VVPGRRRIATIVRSREGAFKGAAALFVNNAPFANLKDVCLGSRIVDAGYWQRIILRELVPESRPTVSRFSPSTAALRALEHATKQKSKTLRADCIGLG